MDNKNMEINDSEMKNAISELMQEGKDLAPQKEWNEIMEETTPVKLDETSIVAKIQKYKYLSAAASVLIVALISAGLAVALNGQEQTNIKTADEKEAPLTTSTKKTVELEEPTLTTGTVVVTENTTPNVDDYEGFPGYRLPTYPTGIKLVSLEPIGPAADTQMYNVTFSWDAQGSDVRFCDEIAVVTMWVNDPSDENTTFISGGTDCDYETQAIRGNSKTYNLEITKGQEVRLFLTAQSSWGYSIDENGNPLAGAGSFVL